MTEDEELIKTEAVRYARKNRKMILEEKCPIEKYPPESIPVSVFMAGSPGAGKTEASVQLIKKFNKDDCIIRIDPDELRSCLPGYKGDNSHIFQHAVSILADDMLSRAIKYRQSFIFDGTFSHIERARSNVRESHRKGRYIQILYVYQDPVQAWHFVQKRKMKDGRDIPKDRFIEQYFSARATVNKIKEEFGKIINVDLLIKNTDGTDQEYYQNIDNIDKYVTEKYDKVALANLLQ